MNRINYAERHSLPNVSAVYVIRSETDTLYIGSSWTLRARLNTHNLREAFAAHGAKFVDWESCEADELSELENRLIRELSPLLNKLASRPKNKKQSKASSKAQLTLTSVRDNCIAKLLAYLEGKPKEKTFAEIAEAINVSAGWLKQLAARKIENPGVVSIETLSFYLERAAK